MTFILLTLGLLVVLFLIMVALARAFQAHSVADLLDWKPTRSPAVEAQNEVDDVRQMIEAQNALRRKRGAKEITEADVQRQAMEDQAGRGGRRIAVGSCPDRRLRLPWPGARRRARRTGLAGPGHQSRGRGTEGDR